NRLATANPAACELFGLMPTDLQQTNPLAFVHRDYRGEIERWISADGAAEEAGGEFEVPIRVAEGNHRWFAVDLNPIHRPDGGFDGLHGFLRDVTVERRERERLQTEASTDPLTGLANRRLFDQTLSEKFEAARRQHTPLSLLMLDLDHFKQVNDEHGHPAGDAVLKNVARVLKRVARRDDLVARTGGEEFAIVLHETDARGAKAAAERCLTMIRETDTSWEDNSVRITISVGVAAFNPTAHVRPEQLVARADAALYDAKLTGRDRASIADQEMDQQVA
ncbi:MAG: GGDEF domain-containing protein, partial [Dehalococcoidia bacterium]|nr:GGDEF domain-containing protein [Dehalococcoidia bacterium]